MRRTIVLLVMGLFLVWLAGPSAEGGTIFSTYGDTWTWEGSSGDGIFPINQPTRGGTGHSACIPDLWSPSHPDICANALDTLLATRAAWPFTPSVTANADGIEVVLHRIGFWSGNEVTVGLYTDNGAARPGTLLREATVSGQLLDMGPADREGSVVRATFASAVGLTAGTTYWVVVSAPSSGTNTTMVVWWYASPALVGAAEGLVECPAAWHTMHNQQAERVAAGTQGCYLGVGAWHPVVDFWRYPLGHSPAFRVTSP
jgi:hypothetical protein